MNPAENPLKFKKNGELRKEIAYTVGGDPSRYGADSDKGLTKGDVFRLAVQLQPEDSDLDLTELRLRDMYDAVCRWAGTEYQSSAGRSWGLRRDNLKAIHRAIDARSPTEDGGKTAAELKEDVDVDDATAEELGALLESHPVRLVVSESDGVHTIEHDSFDDQLVFFAYGSLGYDEDGSWAALEEAAANDAVGIALDDKPHAEQPDASQAGGQA